MEKQTIKKGEKVFFEGAQGKSMYLILTGQVMIYKTIDAEKVELATLSKNTFFGEMSLLLGSHRSASVEAIEDTELMVITKESLLQKIQHDPDFALRVITTMAKRLTDCHDVISRLEGEKRSFEIMYSASGRE